MAVVVEGRPARTRYCLEARYTRPAEVALLEVMPATGRTHQIRVHLSSIGHPVVGDEVYGGNRHPLELDRLFLHASRVTLSHPGTGERVSFESPRPADLGRVLEVLS